MNKISTLVFRVSISLLFFLSGAAGLIYQVTWMRRLMGILGVTSASVTTVLAVFMGGLALGSYLFGRISDRVKSPLALYGLLELAIAGSGIGSIFLLDRLPSIYLQLAPAGESPSIILRMCCSAAALLIPTTLMGGTFPVIVKGLARRGRAIGEEVGMLYAINTLGAVLGTVAASSFLITTFGVSGTIAFAAGLNGLAGIGAYLLQYQVGIIPVPAKTDPTAVPAAATYPPELRLMSLAFFLSGLAALAYEVLWTRYLIYIVGDNSVQAFSTMLAAFLLGIVVGSFAATTWINRFRNTDLVTLFGRVLILLGICSLFTVGLMDALAHRGGGSDLFSRLGQISPFAKCLLILIVPTSLCGATFVIVSQHCSRSSSTIGADVGRIYALNTFGAIIGSIAGGLIILPLAGLRAGLGCLAAVNVLTGMMLIFHPNRKSALKTAIINPINLLLILLLAVAGISVVMSHNPLETSHLSPEDKLLFFQDGAESSVAVIERQSGALHFVVNGDIQADTEAGGQRHLRLLGHLPPLLHPDPKQGLVVCLGTGITAGSMLRHPVEHLDIVELSPIVPGIQHYFTQWNFDLLNDRRVKIFQEDGRNFLFRSDKKYDVITTDPLDPNDAGMTLLYSKEYFELLREHLNDGGIVSQWLPPPPGATYGPKYYRIMLRTFLEVFPNSSIWQAEFTTVIVGVKGSLTVSQDELRRRFESSGIKESFKIVNINSADDLLAGFIGGPKVLQEFTGGSEINTDNWPLLEFMGTSSSEEQNRVAMDDLIKAGDRNFKDWITAQQKTTE